MTLEAAPPARAGAAGPPEGARPLLGSGEALPTQWASLREVTR